MTTPESHISYDSHERRNAIRVSPTAHKIKFRHNNLVLPCVDISVLGVGLSHNENVLLDANAGDIVAFVLDQDDTIIGQIKARLIYREPTHSGWQFTAIEDSVVEFIDSLVLDTQKVALKKAALERLEEDEKHILEQDDDTA